MQISIMLSRLTLVSWADSKSHILRVTNSHEEKWEKTHCSGQEQ